MRAKLASAGTAHPTRSHTPTMIGRRSAALLCVLLVHALVVYSLLHMTVRSRAAGCTTPS